uniref:NLR family CARD domain containing 5 n=1 Tax=Gasterosteus aculeatus aculeatus TaxID=481459 RepID=A0AAQ4PKB0_GASAC
MDEEVDPDSEYVNSVLAHESAELVHILSGQSTAVIMKLCQMMPSDAGCNINQASGNASSEAVTEHIKALLEYFRVANAADCRTFLQSMCVLCDNIPMHLESKLMSAAGYENSACEPSNQSVMAGKSPSPPLEQLIKRPRIDYWMQYIATVKHSLQRRWERVSEQLVTDVQLENVWVGLRTANRTRERPDQTPGPADKGARTPEPDWDYGSMDSRVTLENFLQGCAGKVTVLVGPAGSGKTLLMSCLGQQWAHGLGPIPSFCLFVLLEFHQLNVLSRPLSLSELLLRHYVPVKDSDHNHCSIVDYLLSNPEQSCWVLDGYDKFHSKITKQDVQKELLDPEKPLPVADLISGLLNRQLLPGCTLMVTCRVRDVLDLEGISDKVGQLLGWDCQEIKEYVDNYFGKKGDSANRALGVKAAEVLVSSRHLLAMASLPALCNISCICLHEVQREDQVQIPSTLTQVYLTILSAFLCRDPDTRGNNDKLNTIKLPQSILSHHRSELGELSQLAWNGLEESKILFMKEDISQDVLEFSIKKGLLSQVELRCEDGMLVNSYCFTHLTLQEFLAAVRIMTSDDVSDTQLKKRFSLRTRWMTKSDQRTVFTDSLHLFVCGLASPCCTPALVQLARTPGGTGGQIWVKKRQTLVLNLLTKLCQSNLTGPKILELCHCVQESQDHQLAKQVVGTRPTLELRNIRLLPNDIDALAFVVNSVGDNAIGLDFRACSMESECLDVLPIIPRLIGHLFCSRRYGDKFAEKLSSILPKFKSLRKLEFCGASLTSTGAASLASALPSCPEVTEINLSDNNLKDGGIKHIADIFTKQPRLVLVKLGRNNSSLEAVDFLIGKMSSFLNIQHIHADLLNQKWSRPDMQKLANSLARCPSLSILNLSSNCLGNKGLRKLLDILPRLSAIQEINASDNGIGKERVVMLAGALCSQNNLTETHISGEQVILKFCPDKRMNNSSLPPSDMTPLCKRLVQCHGYLELDLSHCALTDKAIKNLLTVLPKMTSLQRLNHLSGAQVQFVFTESFIEFDSVKAKETSCRLTHCSLKGDILERLLEILQQGPQLADLDLSSNQLEDEGVKTFVDCLQKLKITTYVNLSNNGLTQKGLLDVADTLRTCDNVCGVEISLNAEDRCVIWFTHDEDCERTLSVTDSGLERDHLVRLAEIISVSPSPTKLEFKNNFLQSDWIEDFVKLLNSSQRGFSVSIDERWIRSEEAVSLLCRCLYLSSSIHTIRVQHTTLHLSLVNSTELTSVSLMDCAVEGHHLASMKSVIQRCPSLTELDLSHNSLGIDGAEFLCSVLPSLPNLTSLSIGSKEASVAVVEKLSEALLQAAAIQCLNLSGHAVSDTAAKIMTKMLPRLRSLNLSHCGWSASGGLQLIQTLAECVRLETLCLDCLQLNEDGRMSLAQTLRKINSLRSLKLNKIATTMGPSQANGVLDLLAAMEGLTQMQDIELKGWRMADRGIEELTRLLPFWTELRKISLSKNLISDHMGEMLLEALNSCTHLEELHLPSNSLGNVTAAKMALVVPSLTNITVLDISENSIGYEGSVSLSKAIMCMKNLTKIYLTSVGTSELCPVAASLAHCPLLQDVGLGWNNCGDKVALELVRVMPLCQKLRRIDLESNAISVSGAEALVKALQPCPALQMIRLWRNNVSAIEAQTLSLKERRLNFSST